MNGDGVPDLLVGEPDAAGTAGRVHLVSGMNGATIHVIQGSQAGDHIGADVAYASDLDDDGLPDLAIASRSTAGMAVISFTPWDKISNGVAGVQGIPRLVGRGTPQVGGQILLHLADAAPSSASVLVMGSALTIDPLHGVLTPTADVVVQLATDALGEAQVDGVCRKWGPW